MNYTKPKTFVIHKNDAGTDAFRDEYVHALEAEIERLWTIVNKLPKAAIEPLSKESCVKAHLVALTFADDKEAAEAAWEESDENN